MRNQTLTTMLLQWARSPHAVIVFPLAIPFAFLALYPDWFFTTIGAIDSHIYAGMGVDYDTSLGMAYYKTSRILWQSLHYVFRNLFPPLVAQYSLHILMQMLLAWLFYTLASRLFSPLTALLGSLFLLSWSGYVHAGGIDYHTTLSVPLICLLLLVMLQTAQNPFSKSNVTWLGVCCAALLHTDILAGALLPGMFWFFFVLNRAQTPAQRTHLRKLLYHGLIGGTALTLLLSFISRFFFGRQLAFFKPMIDILQRFASQEGRHTAYHVDWGFHWLFDFFWVALYSLGLLASVWGLIKWAWQRHQPNQTSQQHADRRICLAVYGGFVLGLAVFVIQHILGVVSFNFNHLTVSLLPFALLSILSLFHQAGLTSRRQVVLWLGGAGLFGLVVLLVFYPLPAIQQASQGAVTSLFPTYNKSLRFPLWMLAGLLLVVGSVLQKKPFAGLVRCLVLPLAVIFFFNAQYEQGFSVQQARGCNVQRDYYLAVMQLRNMLVTSDLRKTSNHDTWFRYNLISWGSNTEKASIAKRCGHLNPALRHVAIGWFARTFGIIFTHPKYIYSEPIPIKDVPPKQIEQLIRNSRHGIGMVVLFTRAEKHAKALQQRIENLGGRVIHASTLQWLEQGVLRLPYYVLKIKPA